MADVITVGEILVEIMREKMGLGLSKPGKFLGPFPSGAPAIFTDAVVRLGTSARIVGGVANDEFGKCILNRLEEDGVDTKYIREVDYPSTGTAFVSYFSDGSRKFIYHMENSAAGIITEEDIKEKFVKNAKALHLSGSAIAMSKNMRSACKKAIEIAKDSGTIVSFDPNIRPALLKNSEIETVFSFAKESSDLLIPSTEELETITGENIEENAVKKLLENSKLVALKDGGKGCRLYTKDEKVETDAFEVEEVDPTGAGDAFSAGIVVGWLENKNLKELSVFSNAVGANAVTKMGPMEGLAWREDIDLMVEEKRK
ncbi:MAG: sugar kinase [Candidatus Hadarchaeia archaeon]